MPDGGLVILYPHQPPPELRTMAQDLPNGTALSNDVPNNETHSVRFFTKLFSAWIAMGFRTPKITFVNGTLNANWS